MGVRVPKYRLHKASGQALVELNGRRIYLGKHGTELSQQRYRRAVAEALVEPPAADRSVSEPANDRGGLTVNELILAYWRFTETYYGCGGESTAQLDVRW
jgi:hypothetical protein